MPETVWNPLRRHWVAIAPGRQRRPRSTAAPDTLAEPNEAPSFDPSCPLCPGNEERTPPETWSVRPDGSGPDAPGWTMRCVPNLFPAVEGPGMRHEVLVHSPDHSRSLAGMDSAEASALAGAWAELTAAVMADPDTEFAQASVNWGARAGASLAHPHSQLLGLAFAPPVGVSESAAFGEECPLCPLGDRSDLVVEEGAGCVAVAPPWSEVPYELIVFPSRHEGRPAPESESTAGLGTTLAELTRRTASRLGDAAYNIVLHTEPRGARGFHWHAHVYPRISTFAGIELGAGVSVNSVEPAAAADLYRGP